MEVARTLVKSPPELWAELTDAAVLARHLGEFGEIRIVRTEPESVVEWEGDRASGSVRLEPTGWGTRVTMTAEAAEAPAGEAVEPHAAMAGADEAVSDGVDAVEAEPPPAIEPPRPTRRGFFARLFRRRRRPAAPPEPSEDDGRRLPHAEEDEPDNAPPAADEPPDPPAEEPGVDAAAVLDQALDALGAAHHRPFSR